MNAQNANTHDVVAYVCELIEELDPSTCIVQDSSTYTRT